MSLKEQSFAFIEAYSKKYSIKLLAEVAGVSRSGYYKWKSRGGVNVQDCKDEEMIPLILKIFNDHKGTYERRRIKIALEKEYNMIVSEKRIS